jgi:hypothetical protein
MGDMRNAYKFVVVKHEGKKPVGRYNTDEDIILECVLNKLDSSHEGVLGSGGIAPLII